MRPDRQRALEVGKRVYLRSPTLEDEAEIIARNRASRSLHRGLVTPPADRRAYAEWMKRLQEPWVKGFLVCRIEDRAIVGVFMLNQVVRRFFQSAYMGYYAFKPYNRQGYMGEGLQLVLRHVFAGMKLHRVEANIQPQNAASIALVRRAGFRLEGYSPRYLKISGRWRDHERWAMLVEDWRRVRYASRRGATVRSRTTRPSKRSS